MFKADFFGDIGFFLVELKYLGLPFALAEHAN